MLEKDEVLGVEAFDRVSEVCAGLRGQLERVIIGQEEVIDTLLAALLCEGHVLIVGVPGLAKTLLVRTLALSVDLGFGRIQFTPDMMPSDILGTELIQEDASTGQRGLRFLRGPIFSQLILADEVNRAPPKTQAALLEAMGERQVTVSGETIRLERPFVVVATQNPIEQGGTYPLPEAQLDRFMFSLWMDYPTKQQEVRIVSAGLGGGSQRVEHVIGGEELLRCIGAVAQMPVSGHVVEYAVRLVRATRPQEAGAPEVTRQYVAWGAGPRAGQYLVLGAKAMAAMEGVPTPGCEHVRRAAMGVLRHRVVVNYAGAGDAVGAKQIVSGVLKSVEEPGYEGPG